MVPQQGLRRNLELEALIACGTLELGSVQQAFLSPLPTERFDWDVFFKLSCNHRLAGIVNRGLRNGIPCRAPESVLSCFADASRLQGITNLRLTTVLLELLTELKRAGIAAIPYKGPVLAKQLYGDLSLRASTDLDIVVLPQDLRRTRDCLIEMGFEDGYGLDRIQQEAAFRFGFEHSFTRSGLTLDLHWRIAPCWAARSLDMDAIFRRATLKPFWGTECLCLSDEDMMVALCVHAAQHDWGQLSHFVDVVECLRRFPQLDWEAIRGQMTDSQMERILLVCLQIVSTNWHLELPTWCGAAIQRRPAVTDLASFAKRGWASFGWENPAPWGLIKRTHGENLQDRVAFLAGIVLEPKIPDFRALRLPPGTWWLYWAFRPFRLLWKRLPWLSTKMGDAA